MNNQIISIKNPQILELPVFYQSDIWDMNQCKDIKCPTNFKFEFQLISNPFVRNEIKVYMLDLIKREYNIKTIKHHFKSLIKILPYFIKDSWISISEIEKDEYEKLVRKTHISLGIPLLETQSALNNKFERYEYQVNSKTFNICIKFYQLIYDIKTNLKEIEKDVWDIRKLNFKVKAPEHNPYYTLSFQKIQQKWLKETIKTYSHYRLQSKTLMTVKDDMKCFNKLSSFIKEYYPNATSWAFMNRNVMEQFISYLAKDGLYPKGVNHRISTIKCFLEAAPYLEIKDAPSYNIILSSDFRKPVQKEVETYSKTELQRINKHIAELPIQIARMLFVIQNVGMRISELSTLKTSNLKMVDNEKYILSYLQHKTHKHNTIPIDTIVAQTIQAAIKDSQEEFGSDCEYVFAQTKNRAISANMFRRKINEMAAIHNLKKDDGSPLCIKSHVFRHTVATQYANMGVDMEVLRLMMGHSDYSVLKHYVKIHGTSMLEAMKPILEHDEQLINSIGKEAPIINYETENAMGLSLPNGYCAKPITEGICSHANACYTCRMFKPSKQFIDIYKQQLSEAEKHIQIAKINNHTRLVEINETLVINLTNIINQFENEVQYEQDRCVCEGK